MIVKNTKEQVLKQFEGCEVTQKQTNDQPSDREALYFQHFSSQIHQATSPAGFIQQVTGYGVQVFSQASSFTAR
jgi:hypothetical protein